MINPSLEAPKPPVGTSKKKELDYGDAVKELQEKLAPQLNSNKLTIEEHTFELDEVVRAVRDEFKTKSAPEIRKSAKEITERLLKPVEPPASPTTSPKPVVPIYVFPKVVPKSQHKPTVAAKAKASVAPSDPSVAPKPVDATKANPEPAPIAPPKGIDYGTSLESFKTALLKVGDVIHVETQSGSVYKFRVLSNSGSEVLVEGLNSGFTGRQLSISESSLRLKQPLTFKGGARTSDLTRLEIRKSLLPRLVAKPTEPESDLPSAKQALKNQPSDIEHFQSLLNSVTMRTETSAWAKEAFKIFKYRKTLTIDGNKFHMGEIFRFEGYDYSVMLASARWVDSGFFGIFCSRLCGFRGNGGFSGTDDTECLSEKLDREQFVQG